MNFNPTQEQIDVVQDLMRGHNVLVEALAGTSKSTTALLALNAMRDKRTLYLTFNKHLAVEAAADKKKYKFINFFPMTVHKLAKTFTIDTGEVLIDGELMESSHVTLAGFIHSNELKEMVNRRGYINGWEVSKALKAFCNSEESFDETSQDVIDVFKASVRRGIVTHDMYLKLFMLGLTDKTITLANQYDLFILDECNDASRAIGTVAKHHGIKQSMVLGDRSQSIVEFMLKGYSIFEEPFLKTYEKRPLSRTFRCTQQVCNQAAEYLRLLGIRQKYFGFDREATYVTQAYVTRTNMQCLTTINKLVDEGKKFYTGTPIKELQTLCYNVSTLVKNSDVVSSITKVTQLKGVLKAHNIALDNDVLNDVGMYVYDKEHTGEHMGVLKYLKDHNKAYESIFKLLIDLAKKEVSIKDYFAVIKLHLEKKSNINVLTVFKSKGLTFDSVTLIGFSTVQELREKFVKDLRKELKLAHVDADAFDKFKDDRSLATVRNYRAELMMTYVAGTRARFHANYNGCNADVLEYNP